MKLPRWLVISLNAMSLLCIAAAVGGWWWMYWPERTAQEFVTLWTEGKVDDAEEMLTEDSEVATHYERTTRRLFEENGLRLEPPSIMDLIRGRRVFRLPGYMVFEVETGKIRQRFLN